MMTRHQMRESVFLLTFERIFNGDPLDSIIETARECETVEIDDRVLAWVTGIDEKKTEIDHEIEKHLKKNWDAYAHFEGIACSFARRRLRASVR